ncbi:MAG: hypothetical protein HY396_01375 [Candidatus Doudnabacteria bacterium]|nr:hypothetical protein [Candidatus Doudnabacteria bacterium]
MFRDLGELFGLIYAVLLKGGWVGFVWGLIYMFYKLYIDYIQIRWYKTLPWLFLKITVPKDNEKSPLAFEEILNQLHSIQEHITWAEKYLEGQFQIWFTWEITSIGGAIANYARILPKHRDVFEAAIYAQYPNAEIIETEDYFPKIPKFEPEKSEYDIFAYSFRYIREIYYPTRTYYDFEHATAETFVDPIAGMWEELAKLNPYEMYVIQFVLRPIGDELWKEKGRHLVKKLKGDPKALKGPTDTFGKFMGVILGPILDAFIRPTAVEGRAASEKYEPPSLMLHLTEDEKAVINAVEKKLSKWGYQTKIHCLYLAPKEKYNPGVINRAVIGAFKSFGANNLNALKPLLKRWTKVNYFLFRELEKPVMRLRLNYRKWKYMSLIRRRWYFWGPPPNILSVEEIASYLHFPQIEVKVPPIEKVTVTKVQPPPELPVAPAA